MQNLYNDYKSRTGARKLIDKMMKAGLIEKVGERNNTLYQSVILNKKRIFVKSDRRNGWIIIESVFCFYPATEIANFITEG